MSLQIRRGTNAERLTITPQVGELIYVTDHTSENVAPLWVGDGLTVGGKSAITEVDVGSINDLDDVNVVGATDGQVLGYDAIQDIWNPIDIGVAGSGIIEGSNYRINIAADDSTIMVDTRTNEFNGTLNGTLNGDILGNVLDENNQPIVNAATRELFGRLTGFVEGNLYGDIRGSVFADDSTLLVDAINGVINADLIGNVYGDIRRLSDDSVYLDPEVQEIFLKTKGNGDQSFLFTGTDVTNETDVVMTSGNRNRLIYIKEDLTQDLSSSTSSYGNIDFRRRDLVGEITTGRISGGKDFIYFFNSDQGLTPGAPPVLPYGNFMFYRNGDLGIGTNLPAAKLDVQGDAIFLGDVQAAAFKGSVVADDSTTIVDAINGTVTASGFVQFGSYSDAELSSFTPANGMVYYNTTDNRFRGFQNGAWINLDDGTAV